MFRKFSRSPHNPTEKRDGPSSENNDHSEVSEEPFRRGSSSSNFSSARLDQRDSSPSGLSGSVLNHFPQGKGQSTIDPLGLTLIHSSPQINVDFIFVHGLGGTSRKTWSWNRDLDYFWPSWLPSEKDFSNVRIFTFGYNADFRGPKTTSNITDFSKALLFSMLTYAEDADRQDGPIGSYPIVFIVHSLGGLVVKKAYIIGRSNNQYSDIISQIYGIVFLATPHRGSNLAKTLNNALSISPAGASAKHYIAELEKNSSTLQDINEQFCSICSNLALVSFYENQRTTVAPGVKKFVVDKDSGILGLPNETSSQLDADHHNMCKFKNSEDPSYISTTNVLKMFLARIPKKYRATLEPPGRPSKRAVEMKKIEEILTIHEDPDHDFNVIRKRVLPGSCRWILQKDSFSSWADGQKMYTNVLWLSGPPAMGKTTLISFIIEYLRNNKNEGQCQHYFFNSNDHRKKSVAYFLRALAFQVAQSSADFRNKVLDLYEESGMIFEEQKADVIWGKLFEGILFKMNLGFPLYWVLDALDEAESPSLVANFITKIDSVTPINILLISRVTHGLLVPLNNLTTLIPVSAENISTADTYKDIQAYVEQTVQRNIPGDTTFQLEIIAEILAKASGSFLWVKLALDSVQSNWHTQEDVRKSLDGLPAGIGPLYTRMIDIIASQPPKLQNMAKQILTWTACASRPLHISELNEALVPEFGDFVSLEDTIVQICGHFIVVEKSRVSILHRTALQFLLHETDTLPISLSSQTGHTYIATVCATYLSDSKWRQILTAATEPVPVLGFSGRQAVFKDHPFLTYAISSWAYHVSKSIIDSNSMLAVIRLFFSKYSVSWINAVALLGDLRILTRTAQYLKSFVKRRKLKVSALQNLKLDDNEVLQQWSIDLIRIVGKFGNNLAQNPSSIYKLIPPFCPKNSILSRTFGSSSGTALSVTGISATNWDDCLARIHVGGDETASKVFCTDIYFFVLIATSGTLIVYNSETCEERMRLKHGEYVTGTATNTNSNLFATAGIRTIRVWDIPNGKELCRLSKTEQARVMVLAFGTNDAELLVGFDDCQIQCYSLLTLGIMWTFLAEEVGDKSHSCPRVMSFSPDKKQIAMAYRGKPVLVWDLTNPRQPPRKCVRSEDRFKSENDVWNAPEVICWHAGTSHLLILYQDTILVDWDLIEDEQSEQHHVGAREMTCSPNDNLLLTSDHTGTVKIWTFPNLNLMYQLTYNEFVRDLAFSPDSQRFYDVRGSLCNVWEPDVLYRPADLDHEDQSSSYETSIISEPVISGDDSSRNQITALVCDIDDKYYCCGKDDGSVTMYDTKHGKKLRKLYSHSYAVSVITLAWSLSTKYIVSADDCGRIISKRLEKPTRHTPSKWSVFPSLDFRVQDGVDQFVFNETESLLLMSMPTLDLVWDLHGKREVCRYQHVTKRGKKWVNHPYDQNLIICIDSIEIRLYEWMTLQEQKPNDGLSLPFRTSRINVSHDNIRAFSESLGGRTSIGPMSPSEPLEIVDEIYCTKNRRFIVFETVPNTGHISERLVGRRIDIISVAELRSLSSGIHLSQSINNLARHVERLIGTFQDHVVFFDHQYWLCTWEIETPVETYRKHFFLPKDWSNVDTLKLCLFSMQGTLFCPKNGEVAIVKFGVKV